MFKNDLKIRQVSFVFWDTWELLEDLPYETDLHLYTVPQGFTSDGASTPFVVRSFFPKLGRYAKAAFLHDYLLRTKIVPRKRADDIFFEALIACRVNPPRAWVMWASVRLYSIAIRILGRKH